MAFERFLKRNNEYAEANGDENQVIDTQSILSQIGHDLACLGDLFSGHKKLRDHEHHPVDVLVNGVIDGVEEVGKLRKEMKK